MNSRENIKRLIDITVTACAETAKLGDDRKKALRNGAVASELIAANVAEQSGVSVQTVLIEIAQSLQQKAIELNAKEEHG